MSRVAVVTGSNRGIGFAVVKQLCKEFDGDVILTARSECAGHEACSSLDDEGFHPLFHQLDVCSYESINKLKIFLQNKYGGLDVLVNNAGITYSKRIETPFLDQAEAVIKTNFFGSLHICQELFPLLRPHARVVNVSSRMGVLGLLSDELKETFLSPSLTEDQLSQLMNEFVRSLRDGTTKSRGWEKDLPESTLRYYGNPTSLPYSISKIGLTGLTRVLTRKMSLDSRKDVLINACCPGWIKSQIGGPFAQKLPEEGAKAITYLATLPCGGINLPHESSSWT